MTPKEKLFKTMDRIDVLKKQIFLSEQEELELRNLEAIFRLERLAFGGFVKPKNKML